MSQGLSLTSRLPLRAVLIGLALLVALVAPGMLAAQFDALDHALDDWRTRLVLQSVPEQRIVIIDIDETSLAREGAWPWSRSVLANLLKTLLDDYQVASIAVDMVLPETRPDDAILAEQFRRSQVTGALVYDLETRELNSLQLSLPPAPPLQRHPAAPISRGPLVQANVASLMPGHAGHITPTFDNDGALRHLPPLICATPTSPQGRADCRPILTLAAFASLLAQPQLQLQPGRGWLAPAWELTLTDAVAQNAPPLARLPLTADGMLNIPYRHRKTDWQRISAADILHHQADPAVLKGVMILFGGTALGMGDVIATPISPVAAGLEPHVEILSALLDNDFPFVPQAGIALDGLLILPFALLLAWALGRFRHPLQRAVLFPVWLLFCWGATMALAIWALMAHKLLLPLLPLLLFAPLALLFTVLAELYRTGSEREGVLSLLGAYLPRPVATRLANLANRGNGAATLDSDLDVTRRDITVLFADIHGFAGITEKASPDVVARLMQRVFTEMAESVAQQNGTIDKFIGDAIMAFWNAPDDDPQHAQHALAAAHDIRNRMTALASFCTELGLAPIDVGIGIESGPALVGNFGSLHRRTFTALGEPVVLASRLEGLTSQYQQQILIGQGCASLLGADAVRTLGQVAIRGRLQPLTMYVPA